MKKTLVLVVLLSFSLFFIGCNNKSEDDKNNTSLVGDYQNVCSNNGGEIQVISEGGEDFTLCLFPDESFCFVEDLETGLCKQGDIQYYSGDTEEDADSLLGTNQEPDCSSLPEDIVCGKDGNTYYNRCYLEISGVEEEVELSQVVDGECIFG